MQLWLQTLHLLTLMIIILKKRRSNTQWTELKINVTDSIIAFNFNFNLNRWMDELWHTCPGFTGDTFIVMLQEKKITDFNRINYLWNKHVWGRFQADLLFKRVDQQPDAAVSAAVLVNVSFRQTRCSKLQFYWQRKVENKIQTGEKKDAYSVSDFTEPIMR